MESRRLQRTSSHSRKEGMGDHRLKWLRADIVREPPLPATLRKRKQGSRVAFGSCCAAVLRATITRDRLTRVVAT